MKLHLITHTIYKINSKWIRDLNMRATVIKLLEENIGINLHDLGLGNDFLDITPKAQMIKDKKRDKLPFIKVKKSCASKGTIKKVKRQPAEWEKVSANHLSHLYS